MLKTKIFKFIFLCFISSILVGCNTNKEYNKEKNKTLAEINSKNNWLETNDFDVAQFNAPPLKFGAFTRWWWPGNDVEKEELKRELNAFSDIGIAGVEIQPFIRGLNPNMTDSIKKRVYSWDSPSFYENIQTVAKHAREIGLIVDLNAGSGWSTGGSHLTAEDNFLTIKHTAVEIRGGQQITMNVPPANMEHRGPPPGRTSLANLTLKYGKVLPSLAKLEKVLAVKVIKNGDLRTAKTEQLNPESTKDLTSLVKNGQIRWNAPEGEWEIIAFWSFPSGEMPKWIASEDKGFVPNLLDSTKVIKNYQHLFGDRTGLEPYFGNPIRAIFNDSYEFQVDRHYANDLFEVFEKNRGYDITPWMPANMVPGYNNHAEQGIYPNENPYFIFSKEDWRLRYDYDLTISDLMQEHFFKISKDWFENRNMLHRTQPYGLPMDILAACGNASIPESEQLWAGGSEGFLKVISSGAHIYNRPINSAEAIVYRYRSEMMTPQKIKMSVDKAFAAGVNQVIYHGSAYQYNHPDYSKEGWNPFDSPFTPFLTYSSNIKEASNVWKNLKGVNDYVRRTQYVLRSGKPRGEVLIYYPLLGVEGFSMENPEEILVGGYIKGIEPKEVEGLDKRPERKVNETREWFEKVWPTINALEEAGISWDFVNDASIQQAKFEDGKIDIRGNKYEALFLVNAPYIQLKSADQIQKIAKNGAKFIIIDDIPNKQPSYFNFKENDKKTFDNLTKALTYENASQISVNQLPEWITKIDRRVKFSKNYNFTRVQKRIMSNGDLLQFVWNKSDKWQEISFVVTNNSLKNNYWVDADKGIIFESDKDNISYRLPPYGSIVLYSTGSRISSKLLSETPVTSFDAKKILTLNKWNLKTGNINIPNTELFDWQTNEDVKYSAEDGLYSTSFSVKKEVGVEYFLDLGTVYFTAEIFVNDQKAGKRVFAPYELNITKFLKDGKNKLEVKVTPTERNESIKAALNGDSHYAQYRNREKTMMPGGLLGPVLIKEFKK